MFLWRLEALPLNYSVRSLDSHTNSLITLFVRNVMLTVPKGAWATCADSSLVTLGRHDWSWFRDPQLANHKARTSNNPQKNSGLCRYVTSVCKTSAVHLKLMISATDSSNKLYHKRRTHS